MVIFISLLVAACTLNADQEASLNNAMFAYINSRNKGVVMSYVAYTHPIVVDYYQSLGDSSFTEKFDVLQNETRYKLNDGTIIETKSEGNSIHVQYSFNLITPESNKITKDNVIIIAISDDNGVSWYFMDEDDYSNNQIMDPLHRLIK